MVIIFKFFLTHSYYFIFAYFLWIFADVLYQYSKLYHYRKFNKTPKCESIFYKITFRLPVLIAQYIEDKKSDEFKEHGLILFTGKQGQGKTMAMTYEINKLILQYPDLKILTNYGLICQDVPLNDYLPLLYEDNGLFGLVFALDEIQATFNARQWKDFPPELLSCICQNRKAHRVIFGTVQNVSQVDRAIRLQCRLYKKCYCFFGFFNLVVNFEPEFDFEGNLSKSKFRGFYFFLQEDVLRYQYNTFDIIKSLR